jgi:DNA-directed RNA polymerase subunit RPC12/RpoP
MARIVKTSCPDCGARLQFDPEGTEAKCDYCGAVSRIEKQRPPKGQEAPHTHGPVVYVPKANHAWIAFIILPIVLSMAIGGGVMTKIFGAVGGVAGGVAAGLPGSGGGAGQGLLEHMQWQGNFQPMLADVNGDGAPDPIGWIRFLENSTSMDHLAAFDAATGTRLWMTPAICDGSQSYNAKAALAGDKLVVADPTGVLRAFSIYNGQLVWTGMLGERADRICGAGAGSVRVETTDKRALSVALASGQITPAGTVERETPCVGVQAADRGESLYSRLVGGTWNDGGEVNPEIAGMDVEVVVVDNATGAHVALGGKSPGTRVPTAAMYDARGVTESKRKAVPQWMTAIPAVNPLTVQESSPETGAISQGRVLAPYQLQGSDAGWRLACLELASGRSLWDVAIPNSGSGTMGKIVASDRQLFVSHWTWLDVFDLGTGQHRMTIGVW